MQYVQCMVVISDSCSSDGGTLVRSEPVANAISGVARGALIRSSSSPLSGNRVFRGRGPIDPSQWCRESLTSVVSLRWTSALPG